MDNHAAAGELKKKTRGRCKIPIEKIEKKPNRYVAFTKRRKGLFKKASELSILCGAQISILVRSEGDKVFSFGNPEAVIQSGGGLVPESTAAGQTDDLDQDSAAEIGEEVEEGFTEYVDKDVLLSTDQESAGERVEEMFMVYGEEVDQDVLWSELERKNVHQPAGEIRVKEVFTFYVEEVDQDVLWSELENKNDQDVLWSELEDKNAQQQKNLSFP